MQKEIAQIIVSPIRWQTFLKNYSNGNNPAWLSNMAQEVERTTSSLQSVTQSEITTSPIIQQLSEAPVNQKRDILLAFVNGQALKVLGLDAAEIIDPRQPLQELGLDSLTAVELRNMLGNGLKLERSLPATLVFDYPTINALTEFLAQDILKFETKKSEMKSSDAGEIDLLQNIENLSDEEVARMLSNLE
jgi:acyl carrier protein